MKLKTQFVLFVSLTTVLSVGLSAGGLWLLERRYLRQSTLEQAELAERTVEKTARDALLMNDPISLVSFLRFMRAQWPWVSHARVEWALKGRPYDIAVG